MLACWHGLVTVGAARRLRRVFGVLAFWARQGPVKAGRRRWRLAQRRLNKRRREAAARAVEGDTECASQVTPCPRTISHACVSARYTGNMHRFLCRQRLRTTGGAFSLALGHLGERDAAPTSLELFGRGDFLYVPRFLTPPIPPSLSILFDLYQYSEGTQASTLWRVCLSASWSPSRSCSFCCVSSSPSTLTSTAGLESTFDYR